MATNETTPKAAATIKHTHPAPIHLTGVDPVMARIIEQVGAYDATYRRERFPALARAIIFQQLAGNAARAILKRFIELYPGRRFPSPEQVVATPLARLRKVGLSKPKALYIQGLAADIVAKKVNFHRFPKMEDDAIIAELTQVKGIGQWTAEMFLMFNLGQAGRDAGRRPRRTDRGNESLRIGETPDAQGVARIRRAMETASDRGGMVPMAQPRNRAAGGCGESSAREEL